MYVCINNVAKESSHNLLHLADSLRYINKDRKTKSRDVTKLRENQPNFPLEEMSLNLNFNFNHSYGIPYLLYFCSSLGASSELVSVLSALIDLFTKSVAISKISSASSVFLVLIRYVPIVAVDAVLFCKSA